MTTKLTRMSTTKIARRACYMAPDPCPEPDYIIKGKGIHGDRFEAHVHHRGPRSWVMEEGELRETWVEFRSLQAVIDYLEDPLA